jgi:hypothetical protein
MLFHASTTCRLRCNSIPTLTIKNGPVSNHVGKATILKSFFSYLLGTVAEPSWSLDLTALYTNTLPLPESFSAPFSLEEIRGAFTAMNKLSNPSPDGF